MTYKHKDHMEWLLQETDYYTDNVVTEARIHEIREVYKKAEAWDILRQRLNLEVLTKSGKNFEILRNAMDDIYSEVESGDSHD